MTVYALKLIAAASMLIDHIGVSLFPDQIWMRVAGRLAFPVYAFLICEGFYHTRNIKKYAARLAVAAVVSEIPFDIFRSGAPFDIGAQNTCFTLLIGLLTIWRIHVVNFSGASAAIASGEVPGDADGFTTGAGDGAAASRRSTTGTGGIQTLFTALAGMLAAMLLRSDYGAFGVALILLFYFCRGRRAASVTGMAAANMLYGALNLLSGYLPVQALGAAAALPIYLYNGRKGRSARYLFYAFYPAHLAAIALVSHFIKK